MAAAKRHPAWRALRAIAPLLMVAAGCLSFASPASAAPICGTNGVLSAVGQVYTCTYTTAGEDTFNVPLFVTGVHVVATGQTGGTGAAYECDFNTGDGGAGARVTANIPVTQPTLYVEIPVTNPAGACGGNEQLGYSGGGGGGDGGAPGGGYSAVQRCAESLSCTLTGVPGTDPRLVVAGGGGGGAFFLVNGGDAGTGSNPVCNPAQAGQGTPGYPDAGHGGSGGGCQTSGAGGAGGKGPGGFITDGYQGDNGFFAKGGDGGAIAQEPVEDPDCAYPWPGAGGGSGFLGGGGGGGASYCSGGGGGGGSSYAEPTATNVSMTLADKATPTVAISWVQPVDREYQFLTGHAFALSYTQSPPNPAYSLTNADTGIISTSQTHIFTAPCVPLLVQPVGWPVNTKITEVHGCAAVSTTAGNQLTSKSLAAATITQLVVQIPGQPLVRVREVLSTSKTTCAGSTGTTSIGYLAVGSDVLISHPELVPPNTHFTVGQFSVNVNAQTPFTLAIDKGLIVDGITLAIANESVTAHLIGASSESDIGDCPGQQHVN